MTGLHRHVFVQQQREKFVILVVLSSHQVPRRNYAKLKLKENTFKSIWSACVYPGRPTDRLKFMSVNDIIFSLNKQNISQYIVLYFTKKIQF